MSYLRTYSDVRRAEQVLIYLICEKQKWDRNYTPRRNRREHRTFCLVFLWMEEKKQGIYLKFKTVLTTQCLARESEAEKERGISSFSHPTTDFPRTVTILNNKGKIQIFFLCNARGCSLYCITKGEYGQESAKRAYTATLIYHANKTGHQVRRVLVQLRTRIRWTSFNCQCQIKSPNSASCY